MEKINSLSRLYQLHSSFLKESKNIAFLVTALTHIIAISACLFSVTQADLLVVATQENAPIAMDFIIASQAEELPSTKHKPEEENLVEQKVVEQQAENNEQELVVKDEPKEAAPNTTEEIVTNIAALEKVKPIETIKPKNITKKQVSTKKVKKLEPTPEIATAQNQTSLKTQQLENAEAKRIAAQTQEARQTLLAALISEIEKAKHYPNAARKLGIEGVVNIIVQVDSAGNIVQSKLTNDNSPPLLQKAALATMEKVQRNWSKRANVNNQSLSVTIPIRYALKS